MATHDRNLLKRADIERFQAWLTDNQLAWRPGKGAFQLMQVQLKDGWPAICVSTKDVVTTPPALREMISRFRKGLPYASKAPRAQGESAEFLQDLWDEAALRSMAAIIENPDPSYTAGPRPEHIAVSAANFADAFMAERAKRLQA